MAPQVAASMVPLLSPHGLLLLLRSRLRKFVRLSKALSSGRYNLNCDPSSAIPKSSAYASIGLGVASILTVLVRHYLIPRKYWHWVPNWVRAYSTWTDKVSTHLPCLLFRMPSVSGLSFLRPSLPSPWALGQFSTTSGSKGIPRASTCTCFLSQCVYIGLAFRCRMLTSRSRRVCLRVKVLVVSCRPYFLSLELAAKVRSSGSV